MFGISEVISSGDLGTILLFTFVLGMFTGLGRCLAICGPLFAPLAASSSGSRSRGCKMALAFGAGRLLTYMLLGALAGLFGGILFSTFESPGALRAAYTAVGALGVILGIVLIYGPGFLNQRRCAPGIRARGQQGVWGAFTMGFAVGWIPCPPLMEVLALTLANGKMILGAAMLMVFGVGTALPLLPIGYISGGLSERLQGIQDRRAVDRASGLLLILFGLYLVLLPIRNL